MTEHAEGLKKPWSKRSMQCNRCPEDGSKDGSGGCPFWMVISEGQAEGGPQIVGACIAVQLQRYWMVFIQGIAGAQQASEQARNRAQEAHDLIAEGIQNGQREQQARERQLIHQVAIGGKLTR